MTTGTTCPSVQGPPPRWTPWKCGQDARMIETTVSQRCELASERFLKENDNQRAEREVHCLVCWLALSNLRHNRTTLLAKHIFNPRSHYAEPCCYDFDSGCGTHSRSVGEETWVYCGRGTCGLTSI